MPAFSSRLFRLCRKELRETLRDRRTIITLVLMPLLVYPLLSMTLQRVLLSAPRETDPAFRIYTPEADQARRLNDLLADARSEPPAALQAASEGRVAEFEIFFESGRSPQQMLLQKEVDVLAEFAGGPARALRVTALAGETNSQQARRILLERVEWFNAAVTRQRLVEVSKEVGEPLPDPIATKTTTISGPTATPILATVVPLMLVLMTITGAVYPAIDLTAGERERGTIEAVIASPVSRASILFAKYIAVVTVALLTAVIHLFAMFTTLWAGGLLQFLLGAQTTFPWLAVLQVLGLLVLFSGFFSAVLLALTSFARSFKEAQAYLIPLMLLSITPGIFSLLPGIELAGPLAIVPLVNIILLTRDLLAGTVSAGAATAAILSTVAYAAAALGVAARLFGSDAVLRGSELSLRSMFSRPVKPRLLPTPSEAALTLAILFPVYFVASNLGSKAVETAPPATTAGGEGETTSAVEGWTAEAIGRRMVLNAGVLIVVFGGIPLLVSRFCRDNLQATFRLHRPPWLSLLGATLMGLGLWAFAYELMVFAEQFGMVAVDASKIEAADRLKDRLQELSPVLILVTFAVTPGVIEELCFRGYLFSAFRQVLSPWRLIGLTAVLFGLFHVFTGSALLIERFLPTALVGIALGWVGWRTASIWPCMLFHFTHDALLLMVGRYEGWIQGMGIGTTTGTHLPLLWLLICGGLVGIGSWIVGFSTRKSRRGPPCPLP